MTEQPILITVSHAGNDNVVSELGQKLIGYNSRNFGPMEIMPVTCSIRDAEGALQAGLAGKIFYQWLSIDLLWVADNLRGQGLGSALLQRAEEEALTRGCANVWVDTIGEEALPFYEKNGYEIWGELPDYPPGQVRTFLRKALAKA